MTVPLLVWLAPLLMAFEIWQLVIAERYLGIKQIAKGIDPRERGPSEPVAFSWSLGIVLSWIWMLLLWLPRFSRIYVICMLVVSVTGRSFRLVGGLKWALVILTLEGALRIGLMVSLLGSALRHL